MIMMMMMDHLILVKQPDLVIVNKKEILLNGGFCYSG